MRQLFILIQKEFIQIFRNPLLPRLIVIFPVMVMLVMPWVTTMDVRGVNVAIVDEDASTLSHRIASDVRAAEYFTINAEPTTHSEALGLLEGCKVDVILLIPKDFERDLASVAPQRIDISANAVNATKGSLGSQYLVQTIGSTLSKYRAEQGAPQLTDLTVVQNRYNPTLNYRHLMIPALMIMLVILICGFLSAVNIVSEKESGTIEQINVTPVGKFTFILAKLIPFWLIGLFVISVAMVVAWVVYGLTPLGSLGNIYLATILFILWLRCDRGQPLRQHPADHVRDVLLHHHLHTAERTAHPHQLHARVGTEVHHHPSAPLLHRHHACSLPEGDHLCRTVAPLRRPRHFRHPLQPPRGHHL